MHLVWNIFAVVGLTVTLALLGAGVWVWAVVVRNVLLSARGTTTNPHAANVTLPELQLMRSEMRRTHPVHAVNDEIN